MVSSGGCVFLALLACAFAYNAPPSHVAEEVRFINLELHGIVDQLVWGNAFKWSDAATGTVNTAVLAQIEVDFTAALDARTTSTFRQCDRLNSICYQCENGGANVSKASVELLRNAKLFGQENNHLDASVNEVGTQTYQLFSNTRVPVWTPNAFCRTNATCFPSVTSQLVQGMLQGSRMLTFKKVNGTYLIDRINTGARSTYFPSYEFGVKVLSVNYGMQLVPTDILDNYNLTGIFCFPSKRSIVYYTHRGLPLIDEPY